MSGGLRAVVRDCGQGLAWWAARSYVAGPALSDATRVCRRLGQRSIAATMGLWNSDDDDPRDIANGNLTALNAIVAYELNARLAVKAPALRFDPKLAEQLAVSAREAGVWLHFDAHALEAADPTFELVAACAARGTRVGCTLPGRWPRSVADAGWAVARGLCVRVVKGQWADPRAPDADPRHGYLRVIDRLARRAQHVSVATHDPGLAREALRRLLPGTPCELELLFGLPMQEPMQVAREAGVPVRVYVPYGRAWLPYALKQAMKEVPLAFRMARDVVLGRKFWLLR